MLVLVESLELLQRPHVTGHARLTSGSVRQASFLNWQIGPSVQVGLTVVNTEGVLLPPATPGELLPLEGVLPLLLPPALLPPDVLPAEAVLPLTPGEALIGELLVGLVTLHNPHLIGQVLPNNLHSLRVMILQKTSSV